VPDVIVEERFDDGDRPTSVVRRGLGSSFSTKDTDNVTANGVEVKAKADLAPNSTTRPRAHGSLPERQ